MVYEDLDAGDETRRNGDYVSLAHPDADGTALDSVTVAQGKVVTYDGTDIATVTGDNTDAVAGVLANYDVSGDTGQETVGEGANIKMRGEVIADLTEHVASAGVTAGTPIGANAEVYPIEEVDADNDLWRVQVR